MRKLHFVNACSGCRALLKRFFWIGFALLLSVSCKQSENVELEDVYGKWDIIRADRNGRETSYLRNGYFQINTNGQMTINITGEEEKGSYRIENKQIVMEGQKSFEIVHLQNDSMVMKFNPGQNTQFLFYMLKKNENVQ